MPEVARTVIRDRLAHGLPPRPSPPEFARILFEADIAAYESCQGHDAPVFFDRGIADSLGMMFECGAIGLAEVRTALSQRPLARTALFFPPWEGIFSQDSERDQSFRESVSIAARLSGWYESLGFELLEVPRESPEARADFIVEFLGRASETDQGVPR